MMFRKVSGYMMVRLDNPKWNRLQILLFYVVAGSIMCFYGVSADASNQHSDKTQNTGIELDLDQSASRLENGMLDIPDSFREEMTFYIWMEKALEWYASERGIKDLYYCDMRNDILYGSREFFVQEDYWKELKKWEYSVQNEGKNLYFKDSYSLKLEGTQGHGLYVKVNGVTGKVHLYPAEDGNVFEYFYQSGKTEAYKEIVRDEDNEIVYYPDYYVEADWDDMEREDMHFAGVSMDELQSLDYLRVPDEIGPMWDVYLDVASILGRYMEENQIEDVFCFDADEDIVCSVTNMIFTCRVRGESQTLYIDIDGYNMKCHVYRIEE